MGNFYVETTLDSFMIKSSVTQAVVNHVLEMLRVRKLSDASRKLGQNYHVHVTKDKGMIFLGNNLK